MSGKTRKIVQAVLYEVIAILVVTPVFSVVFDKPLKSSGTLTILISMIALSWNIIFNTAFEYWEARQKNRERTLKRRIFHALAFECGLNSISIPLFSYWLNISLWSAFITDFILTIFFLFYTFMFHWACDKIFDVPDSAKIVR